MITLVAIRIENIRSFVGAHNINLSKLPGLKLMSGRNEVEPRLGGNGAGKSSLWDAVCFCFYGTGIRGQRASDLTSWATSQPSVEATLTINSIEHRIWRQGSPNRLEIDGTPVEQYEVDNLLGLTKDRFLQSVIFGQGASLFLDLSASGRSALLDTVLDLSVWLNASERAGKQASVFEKQVIDLDQKLAHEKGRLTELDNTQLTEASQTWETEHENNIENCLDQLEEAEADLASIVDPAITTVDTAALSAEIGTIQELLFEYKNNERELRFLNNNESCPTCGQPISEHFREIRIASLSLNDAAELREQLSVKQEELLELNNENAASRSRVATTSQRRQLAKGRVDRLTRQAEHLNKAVNPFAQQLQEVANRLEELKLSIKALQKQKNHINGQRALADYWKTAFKKVRLYQVQQILARMELEVQNAAATLGISSWGIKFVTETATKSGTMRPGIQVMVESPYHKGPWETMSGGEAQRLRLAVALGMSSLIQTLAGVSYGFEVWDEPTNWMSPEGIEDLLTALAARADITGKSIWILDHRALTYAGFSEVWTTVKTNEGSRVELTSQMN